MPSTSRVPPSLCPSCGSRIQQNEIQLSGVFRCPSCGQSLRVSTFWSRRIVLASEVLAGLISYGLGVRGHALGLAILFGFIPIGVVLTSLARRFDAPKLKPSDAYALNVNRRRVRGAGLNKV